MTSRGFVSACTVDLVPLEHGLTMQLLAENSNGPLRKLDGARWRDNVEVNEAPRT